MSMRRSLCKLLLTGLLALGVNVVLPAHAEEPIKAVFDLAEGLDQASRAIANIRNELAAEPNAKIVVVAHGDGIKFLLDGAVDSHGRPFAAMVAALVAKGVEFRVCNNTLTAFNIPPANVIPQAKIVPAGIAEILRLQARQGYAYFHP
jgi:intracellular sulfur oxidation DsrE/DsrF family protein